MVDAYIAGAERIVGRRTGAAYRLPDSPWRVVWHTTEGRPSSVDNARAQAASHDTPPHLWAYPRFDWVGQTVPLTLSSYALRHDRGDPETNHRHAIQIEVFGFAAEALLTTDVADWLGRRVLAPILAAGVPVDIWSVAPSTGADGYGFDGAVRQSWDWWATFNGQCGHSSVPGNDHWDPGKADYLRVARATNHAPDPVEDEMRAIELVPPSGAWLLVLGGAAIPYRSGADRDAARAILADAGIPVTARNVDAGTYAWWRRWLLAHDPVDPATFAAAIAAELGGTADAAQVEAAVRRVFADAAET